MVSLGLRMKASLPSRVTGILPVDLGTIHPAVVVDGTFSLELNPVMVFTSTRATRTLATTFSLM